MANILVVHDDKPHLSVLSDKVAKMGHTVFPADSVDAALSSLEANKTDIIITDSTKSDTLGIEFCQKIREHQQYSEVPLLLVTSKDDVEHANHAFEAGADECITHPILDSELKAKTTNILKNSALKRNLHSKAKEAEATALAAMKDSSEIGVVNRFLRDSFRTRNLNDLVNIMFKVLRNAGLSGCAQVTFAKNKQNFSDTGSSVSSREGALLEKVAVGDQRIVSYGKICLFKGEHCCLLVRNLPAEDEQRYGRLKDSLMILMDGMDARLKSLDMEIQLVEHQELAWNSLTDIESQFKAHEKNTIQIMDDLMQDMNAAMSVLDLTEQQEVYFFNLVDQSMERLVSLYSSGIMIDQGLLKLRELLSDSRKFTDGKDMKAAD